MVISMNNSEEKFHESRIAFFIFDEDVKILKNSKMSHKEWANSIGIDDSKFNEIVRGYILGDNIVFYKGEFKYDDSVVECAIKYSPILKERCNLTGEYNVYCGVKKGNIGDVWPLDHYVCRM